LLLAPIILLVSLLTVTKVKASNKLQLRLNDSVSIYSEKAYRRDGGTYFEAIGNVVVSSGKDTLYGEKATFNTKTGKVEIEGSVRYIGQNITIYGAKILYNMVSQSLEMFSARMITPEFSIVASKLVKKSDKLYFADEAEFTTCRDCTESWQVFGKKVSIEIDQYVQIHHALVKVKGVDVLYLPYIALPIKNTRESGLLFPLISTQNKEGFIYEQPIYWAINNQKDMTFTPTFLSERGYGLDLEYREVFGENKWLEFTNKTVVDKIYQPEKLNTSTSGSSYFRHFFELENHMQWSNSFSHHLRVVGTKDLDFVRDFSFYTQDFDQSNDLGLNFSMDKRFNSFSIGLESDYKKNLLESDPEVFDSSYVQVLPSVNFAVMPHLLWQFESDFFYKLSTGISGNITSFKQNRVEELGLKRNVHRMDVTPFLDLNIMNLGPVVLKSKYQVDYQEYKFVDKDDSRFYKQSGLVSTELSFTVDRIFGLAYEEEFDSSEISEKDLIKISNQKVQKSSSVLGKGIIGKLPRIESSITKERITVKKSSYRHSQEFKFIHHQLVHSGESGNEYFYKQIASEDGWFDYRDSITENLLELESNEARTNIPLNNTLELQWNNVLVRKTTKNFHYLEDRKFLKDNFNYSKFGYFNVSQGLLLKNAGSDFEDRLTRLFVNTGYSASRWSLSFKDYYLHKGGDHILSFSGQKRFDRLSLLAQYNYNSFPDSSLKTVKGGFQFRPIDVFGFSILKEHDLDASENINSIYQVDFMPNNNCWIVNLNYTENFTEQRFWIGYKVNFGSDEFKNYRTNFFNYSRLAE
jgi:LPS-assembly protein